MEITDDLTVQEAARELASAHRSGQAVVRVHCGGVQIDYAREYWINGREPGTLINEGPAVLTSNGTAKVRGMSPAEVEGEVIRLLES